MNRTAGKGFIILLFIISVVFVFVFGAQINEQSTTYALTEGYWDDFTSNELTLMDGNLPNSEQNPYLIESPQDLAYLSANANSGESYDGIYFLQTQDIDLSAHYFTPIGYGEYYSFQGIYDGGNYKIDNLIIDLPQSNLPVGLFGNASQNSQLKNIILNSGEITASSGVGSLAGGFTGNIIENCISRINIYEGQSIIQYIGGLVGSNYGKIINSYFEGNIFAASGQYIGGISGANGIQTMQPNPDHGVIQDSFNAGYIEGSSYVGGIVGENFGLIENIYNAGDIVSQSYTGGIAGYSAGDIRSGYNTGSLDTDIGYNGTIIGQNTGLIERLYFNTNTANEFYNIGAIGQENEGINNALNDLINDVLPLFYYQMVNTASSMNLDESHWAYTSASSDMGYTPYLSFCSEDVKYFSELQLFGGDKENPDWGTEVEPYLINSPYQFDFLSININNNDISYLDKYFEIMNDIDFSFLTSEFQPIGKSTLAFEGNVEGNSYVLRNLVLDRQSDYTALFAYNNAVIKNLTIENFDIKGGDWTAALAAINSNNIENITLVDSNIEGNNNIGGLVAQNQNGNLSFLDISNSSVYGNNNIGGAVGYNSKAQALISDLTIDTTVSGKDNIGGIVGWSDEDIIIENSFFIGDISGEDSVGGIIGLASEDVTISSSFVNTNKITGVENVGGLIGKTVYNANIDICYVTADIEGQTNIAGFIGQADYATVAESYFVGIIYFETNGASISNSDGTFAGVYYNKDLLLLEGITLNGEGKTTVELTNNVDIGLSYAYDNSQGILGYYPQIAYHKNNNANISLSSVEVYYFNGGSGSQSTPYLIAESLHLFNMKRLIDVNYMDYYNKFFSLEGDITLEEDFEPIASFDNPFMGRLNGNYYSIYNLTINLPNTDYVGLFSAIGEDARIEKLNIRPLVISSEEVYGEVIGKNYVGAFAGYNQGFIWDCMNNTDIQGESYVGGIAGKSSYISRSFNTAAITGDTNIGGLTGENAENIDHSFNSGYIKVNISNGGGLVANNYGTITYCYNSGSIESDIVMDEYIGDIKGGLVGTNQSGATVRNSYNIGSIQGQTGMIGGGIIASNLSSEDISYSYYNKEIISEFDAIGSGNQIVDNVLGLSTIEMVGGDALSNMTFPDIEFVSEEERGKDADYSPQLEEFYNKDVLASENILIVEIIQTYSRQSVMLRLFGRDVYNVMDWGSIDNPYLIATYDHLDTLSMQVGEGYTFDGSYFLVTGDIIITSNFLSIGRYDINQPSESTIFNGIFDGGGFTISNLNLGSLASQYSQGLFGYTGSDSIIKNINISSGNVMGTEKVGSVVGYSLGEISKCYSSANVQGSASVGGIVGQIKTNMASHIVFNGNVLGNSNWGGLIGNFEGASELYNGWFVVDINTQYTHNNIGSVLYVDANGTVQPGVDMTAADDKDFIYFDFIPDTGFGFDIRNINDNSIQFDGGGLVGDRYFPMYNYDAFMGYSIRWYARFTKTVDISDNLTNGSATGGGEYYEGQTVRIIINPDLGYRLVLDTEFFESYSGDGEQIVATTTMGSEAWTFDAQFEEFGTGNEIKNPLGDPATIDQDSFVYDGEVKEYTINISGGFTYTVEYYLDAYNLLIDGAVDADTYRMELRLHEDGYTVGAKIIIFEIVPKQLQLKLDILENEEYSVKQYDRFSYDYISIGNNAIEENIIVGDDDIELTAKRTFYNQSYEPDGNIGENKLITFNSFSITGPVTDTKNYSVPDEIAYIEGSIIKRIAYINILPKNLTKEYDGNKPYISAHSFEGVFGDDGLFVNEFSFTRVDEQTTENWNIGDYKVGLTEDPNDIDGNKENYDIYFNEEYIFTITPKIVEDVTFSGYQNIQYTGQSLNNSISATYDITETVQETAELVFYQNNQIIEECINAGDYIVKATIPDINFILVGEQSVSFSVSKIEQTTALTLEDINDNTYQLDNVTLLAQGGDGPTNIKYEVVSGKASVTGDILRIYGAGDISVRAVKPESTNYYTQYSNIVTFNISKGVLTANITDTYMSYGTIPQVEISYTGYLRGESSKDDIAGLVEPEILIEADALEVSQEGYLISLRDNGSSDGYIIDVSMAEARLFVEKRQIRITADATSKLYGEDDPELTYSVQEGDITLQGSLARVNGESAGSYLIEQNTLNAQNNPNYDIVYIPSSFTIYPRDLRVSIPVYTKIYGTADPEPQFIVNEEDLRMGDNISVLSGDIVRQSGENVGQYPYSYNNVSAGQNYTIRFIEIRYLKIEKAYPNIQQLEAQAITYGQTLEQSQIMGRADVEGDFVWQDPSIMPKVANSELTNYSAVFIPSDTINYNSVDLSLKIIVQPRRAVISFIGARTHIYDGEDKTNLSASAFNTLEEDDVVVDLSYDSQFLIDVGTYNVTVSINDDNYYLKDEDKTISVQILPKQLEVTLKDATITEGEEFEPEFIYSGFCVQDNVDSLIQEPIVNIPTDPGEYEIMPEGAEAKNYVFKYKAGVIIINRKDYISEDNNISLVGEIPHDASVSMETLKEGSSSFSVMNDYVMDAISVTDYKNYRLANFHNIESSFDFPQEMTYKIAMDNPAGLPLALYYSDGSVELMSNYEYEDGFVVFTASNVSGVGAIREPSAIEAYGMYMLYGGIALATVLIVTISVILAKRIKKKRINTKPRFYK